MATSTYAQMPPAASYYGTSSNPYLDTYVNFLNNLRYYAPPTVAYSSVHVRHGFLRKVYGILSAQLLLTLAVSVLFIAFDPIGDFIKSNSWILIVCSVLSLALIFAMEMYRREHPKNVLMLAVFTALESVLVGIAVTCYSLSSVLKAMFLTLSVTVTLTIYTFQSRRDYSSWNSGLFAALLILLMTSIMQIFLQSGILELLIAVSGALLFSLYIIYDTHQIMEKLSPEEYIQASISLYLDVINLFLSFLGLSGKKRDD